MKRQVGKFLMLMLFCVGLVVNATAGAENLSTYEEAYGHIQQFVDTSSVVRKKFEALGLAKQYQAVQYSNETRYFTAPALVEVLVPLRYAYYNIHGTDCYNIVENYRRAEVYRYYKPVTLDFVKTNEDKSSTCEIFAKFSEPEELVHPGEYVIFLDLKNSSFYENFGCGMLLLFHFDVKGSLVKHHYSEYCN